MPSDTLSMGVALGSNQGDRMAHLRAALVWLKEFSLGPVLYSQAYETVPIGCEPGTPSFLNAVCEIVTCEKPLEFLRKMRAFERKRGRPEVYEKNAPRPLDMDLLYAGDMEITTSELTLPHPRWNEREFVLRPLADIRPHLKLPGEVRTVIEILASNHKDQGVVTWKDLI